jgi:hypothetical protein
MTGSGATIQALGRTLADSGHLSNTLVVEYGTTVHNLISIPKFDRLGYATVNASQIPCGNMRLG